jgi:hypothetical protein
MEIANTDISKVRPAASMRKPKSENWKLVNTDVDPMRFVPVST